MYAASFVDSLSRLFRPLLGAFLDVSCVACGADAGRLCAACTASLVRPRFACIGCGHASHSLGTCAACRGRWHVRELVAAARYEDGGVAPAIKALKYGFDRGLARCLGTCLMRAAAGHIPELPLFVPVPLHPHRRRWRGFNHAELLARAAAGIALMPFSDCLIRLRDTGPQVRTSGRTERLESMTGAFAVRGTAVVAGRNVILVDDVCTTGATLEGCARALLEAQARSVTGLVLARR